MKKRVFIVCSHHHVVKEWFSYKGKGAHLLSFDYHTDFREAFISKSGDPRACYAYSSTLHKSYLSRHISCRDLEAAIKDLKNDEHIDFAIKSGMIGKAFVFSRDSSSEIGKRVLSVPNKRKRVDQAEIISYSENNHPLAKPCPYSDPKAEVIAKIITADIVLDEVIKTFREYGFNQDNYILDFDCDFIRDKYAMKHGKYQTLQNLINGAKAITIARERSFVYKCSNRTLSYKKVEDWLVTLIKESCGGDVEIVEEKNRK